MLSYFLSNLFNFNYEQMPNFVAQAILSLLSFGRRGKSGHLRAA